MLRNFRAATAAPAEMSPGCLGKAHPRSTDAAAGCGHVAQHPLPGTSTPSCPATSMSRQSIARNTPRKGRTKGKQKRRAARAGMCIQLPISSEQRCWKPGVCVSLVLRLMRTEPMCIIETIALLELFPNSMVWH